MASLEISGANWIDDLPLYDDQTEPHPPKRHFHFSTLLWDAPCPVSNSSLPLPPTPLLLTIEIHTAPPKFWKSRSREAVLYWPIENSRQSYWWLWENIPRKQPNQLIAQLIYIQHKEHCRMYPSFGFTSTKMLGVRLLCFPIAIHGKYCSCILIPQTSGEARPELVWRNGNVL